jgi:hypothetical protein
VVRRLLALVCCWWSRDRIRSSPHQGRLLRLGPGAILVVAGESARVVERRPHEAGVVYRCTTANGDREVLVRLDGKVVTGGRTLDETEIEAIPGPACSRPFNF